MPHEAKESGSAGARWAGAGQSNAEDSAKAGADAVTAAISGEDPRLVLLFASPGYDLEVLAAAAREAAGGAELIGCSTAGEIATSGASDASVAAFAIGGPGFSVATAAGDSGPGADLRAAGAQAARCMERVEPLQHRVLVLLADGLEGDPQEIVRGAYSVVGAAVPLVGGCAGDDLHMRQTWQIHGDRVLRGSVVAAALASDEPFGIGVRHGWRPVGEPLLVTESHETTVRKLNDQPALDVYLDLLNAPPEARTGGEDFARYAMLHPFGVASARGREIQIRFVSGANFEERSLRCIAEVPQGTLTWLMEGDAQSVLGATDAACGEALAPLGGRPPLGLVTFDCIARRGVLGDEGVKQEVDRLSACASGAPVAGFYTYGEIARTHGTAGFHNQTLVVLAIG
jgi:hypothetical protein